MLYVSHFVCPSVCYNDWWKVHFPPHSRYHSITSDVLTSVKKMEESLKRLKKARKSAAAAGMSDDDKIRLQLYLDVQHFGDQVRNCWLRYISVRTRQNFQARALGNFHDRVSSAARAWGHKFSSEAMHVYMGENRFSLWSYHIGTVFKCSQLSFDIYKVSNHHLIHDIHQMTSGLPNLYKFQWAITSSLSYVEYWPRCTQHLAGSRP